MKTKEETLKFLRENFKPVKQGKAIEVGFFRPEDAMGVVECCYSVYGEAYPIDTYYLPEKLTEQNTRGNIYSVVARTTDGEVVGHGAAYRSSSPFGGMYEAGQYIIQKAYRGSGAAQEIARYVSQVCPEKFDLAAVYGEVVTNHIITQKMAARLGWVETALELELMPAEAYEAEQSATGRVSTLLTFNILKDRPHTIYPPAPYLNRITSDICELSLDREITNPQKSGMPLEKSTTDIEFFDFAGVGRLQISEAGRDIYRIIDDFELENLAREYKVIQLFISLAQVHTDEICTRLNEKGYFYGGYLPRWMDGDAILLQKIVPSPDFEGLKLYTDKAKQLLEYVKKDWERISS